MNWVFTPAERRPAFYIMNSRLCLSSDTKVEPQSEEEALEWSIAKWKAVLETSKQGTNLISSGSNFTCGCCIFAAGFHSNGVSENECLTKCPIGRRVEQAGCNGTPYMAAALDSERGAQKEIDFLKDTLIWWLGQKSKVDAASDMVSKTECKAEPKTHFVVWREGIELKPGEVALRLVGIVWAGGVQLEEVDQQGKNIGDGDILRILDNEKKLRLIIHTSAHIYKGENGQAEVV